MAVTMNGEKISVVTTWPRYPDNPYCTIIDTFIGDVSLSVVCCNGAFVFLQQDGTVTIGKQELQTEPRKDGWNSVLTLSGHSMYIVEFKDGFWLKITSGGYVSAGTVEKTFFENVSGAAAN